MEGGERGVGAWRWSLWWGFAAAGGWRFVCVCCFAVRSPLVGSVPSSFVVVALLFVACWSGLVLLRLLFCFVAVRSLLVRLVFASFVLDL